MQLDDYVEPEVGVAIAAVAVILSSRLRQVVHRGAVYGVTGALAAGDAVTSFGRGVSRGWHSPGAPGALQPGDASPRTSHGQGASTTEDRVT
jgi:hypothetical protein